MNAKQSAQALLRMKFLKNPIVQTALVVVGVLVVLSFVKPWLAKVPLLNRI